LVRIVLGIVGILGSVGVLVLGVGFLQADTLIGSLDPVARLTAPGSARFDAEERDYTVSFNVRRPESLVNDARCTITHPNESVTRIRGDRQSVSVAGETIGEFEGRGGPTTVACSFAERGPNTVARIVVAPQREWIRIVGFVLIGAGVVGILVSVALILFGVRARQA
jgi:hypothetical protein